MSKDILDNLELLCDRSDEQDRKFLLLAALVTDRTEAMEKGQKELIDAVSETNKNLNILKDILVDEVAIRKNCPITKNIENYEKFSFFMRYPRITILLFLGIAAVISGVVGNEFFSWVKTFVK